MRIAIHPDDYTDSRIGKADASSPRWSRALRKAGHEVEWVNVFADDIVERLSRCDGLMWRHGHNARDRAVARRLLPVAENELGLCVYPDQATCAHFDDKLAQFYLFESLGIPTPRTRVFYDQAEAQRFCDRTTYPLVLKLSAGAGSSQVRLLRNQNDARQWLTQLFGPGVRTLGQLPGFSIAGALSRGRDALRWCLTGEKPNAGSAWELHKNYALIQEFLPGNEGDTRITVIGDRAFGYRRFNRENDFRASGSGRFDPDPSGIDSQAVKLAFHAARALGTQSAAMDFLRTEHGWVVTEVSYAYVSWMVHACPGHWHIDNKVAAEQSTSLQWRAGHMWPEDAQIADYLDRLNQRQGTRVRRMAA